MARKKSTSAQQQNEISKLSYPNEISKLSYPYLGRGMHRTFGPAGPH
jgi:hypothetical protein